jgi:stage V sporulation protein B
MYGSAAKLAQIPYSLLVALNFLVFPYIAKSVAEAAPHETSRYIRHALRLGAALIVGPTIVLAVLSADTVPLVFGAAYADAARVLNVLVWGYVAFSLLTMAATVINGSGRPVVSLIITGATVLAQATFAWLLIPREGIVGGALASSAAYSLGFVAALVYLATTFGAVIPWASVVRIAIATLVVVAAGHSPLGSAPVVASAPILGAIYLLMLVLLREWNTAELKAAIGRSPKPA